MDVSDSLLMSVLWQAPRATALSCRTCGSLLQQQRHCTRRPSATPPSWRQAQLALQQQLSVACVGTCATSPRRHLTSMAASSDQPLATPTIEDEAPQRKPEQAPHQPGGQVSATCFCGDVCVTVNDCNVAPIASSICHCTKCRALTGITLHKGAL